MTGSLRFEEFQTKMIPICVRAAWNIPGAVDWLYDADHMWWLNAASPPYISYPLAVQAFHKRQRRVINVRWT